MISQIISEFLIRRAVAMHSINYKDLANWEPWLGCRAVSEACKNCYYYSQHSSKFPVGQIEITNDFYKPLTHIPSEKFVATCFMTDFFIEEADKYRSKLWHIIKNRRDLNFIILTKRVKRVEKCLPNDWKSGYNNVILGCTVENQKRADEIM